MENFEERARSFFARLISDSLTKLKEVDEGYEDVCSVRKRASQKFEQLLNTLDKKDREFLDCFMDDIHLGECMEQEWLYLQGYKDCMKFLRLVEAI